MKALLVAGLLALGALAIVPSVDAADPASQQPPPCGASSEWACPTPVCRQAQVDETDVLAVIGALGPWGFVYAGPHFGVRLNSDCTVDAWETWADGLNCESAVLPLVYQEQTLDTQRVDATVGACGIGFICACMPADVSAASVQPPSPCGPTALCEGPSACVPRELATVGLPVQLTIRIDGDCTPAVSESGTPCPGLTEPVLVHVDGIVPIAAEACRLSLDCTCDPLPIDRAAAASLPPIFQPCPSMGGCCGIEPEGGCPPAGPQCPETSVSTTDLFGFLGPSAAAATHSGCTVDVSVSDPACPSLAPNQGHADPSAGPVRAHADTCSPSLDCTCDPLPVEVAAAALQPPVTVEFPVCVTDPCPPKVTCHVAPHDLQVATVTVSESCLVTIVEAPPGCQAIDPHPTTVGPVTVIYWTCSGGPDDE
jgi:hypothetical protein